MPMASFGVGGEFGQGGKYDNGGRFDLRPAGAGQGVSLIVGLGDYAGGELFVEGEPIDIRYAPARFNGWKQRHWTNAFEGERFSLVWFTPLGCEFGSGLALARSYDPAG